MNASNKELSPQAITLGRLIPAIFLSSVGAVLFSLAIFRLLSFFIMPSMFFALLLIGFPIGAAIASRQQRSDARRFRRVLGFLAAIMIASVGITLMARHVDHMRASLLFGVNPEQLLKQVMTFALFYLPFFVAYGAAEYVGYLAGTSAFGERMRPVYGMFLFGGAMAFALAAGLQQSLGVPRLLILAVAAVSISRLLLATEGFGRALIEPVILILLICWPGFDSFFMNAFKSPATVPDSVAGVLKDNRDATVVSKWGKYAYVDIVRLPQEDGSVTSAGYYNDIAMWLYQGGGQIPEGFRLEPRDRVPELFLPEKGRVAVLGSGGGREVQMARRAGAEYVLALEIEPRVVNLIKTDLQDQFDHVYSQQQVDVRAEEARSYFENTKDRFDLIMMISVGGYPQLMLEPGNMIRTRTAFQLFVDHLSEQGLLAIGYSAQLDKDGVLLRQYFHTLIGLGMDVYAYSRPDQESFLLLAFRPDASQDQKDQWAQARSRLEESAVQRTEEELKLADFQPITDDRPYLGGNISKILSSEQIQFMFLILSMVVGICGVIAMLVMHHRMRSSPCPTNPFGFLLVGLLIGANFMLLEHFCVTQLFQNLYAYYDSLLIGMVAFLTLTGLGSFLFPRSWLIPLIGVSLLLSAGWFYEPASGMRALLLLIPLAMVAGTFFPVVFDQVPSGRLELFVMDALGAAMGALLSFFIPMLYGFRVFGIIVFVVLLLTMGGMFWFLLRTRKG